MTDSTTTIQSGFARRRSEALFPRLFPDAGWWCPSLQVPAGTRLHDLSRGNWGTLTNMTLASAWAVNGGRGALDFDGVNDTVLFGDVLDSVFVGASARFSISAWVRVGATGNRGIISKLGDSTQSENQRQFVLRSLDLDLDFLWFGGLTATDFRVIRAGTKLVQNQWTHVGATFDASIASADSKVQLFINGIQQSVTIPFTGGSPVSIQNGTAQLAIGATAGTTGTTLGAPFSGQMDDIRIFASTLYPGDVAQLYRLGRGNMPIARRRRYTEQAAGGFKSYWARRSSQIIGAGI